MKGQELAMTIGACVVIGGLIVFSVVRFVVDRRAARRADGGRWASWRDEPRALGEVKDNEEPPSSSGAL